MTLLEVFEKGDPDSAGIAKRMNEEGRSLCDHGRCPCISICGVYLDRGAMRTKPVPREVRLDWLAHFFQLLRKDGNATEEELERLLRICGPERLTKEWMDNYLPVSTVLGLR